MGVRAAPNRVAQQIRNRIAAVVICPTPWSLPATYKAYCPLANTTDLPGHEGRSLFSIANGKRALSRWLKCGSVAECLSA